MPPWLPTRYGGNVPATCRHFAVSREPWIGSLVAFGACQASEAQISHYGVMATRPGWSPQGIGHDCSRSASRRRRRTSRRTSTTSRPRRPANGRCRTGVAPSCGGASTPVTANRSAILAPSRRAVLASQEPAPLGRRLVLLSEVLAFWVRPVPDSTPSRPWRLEPPRLPVQRGLGRPCLGELARLCRHNYRLDAGPEPLAPVFFGGKNPGPVGTATKTGRGGVVAAVLCS